MSDLTPGDAPRPSLPDSHDGFVRRLGRRYLLVLLAAAGLIIADQAVIQPLLVRMNVYAPVINLAGRQRMLSQKLTKAALVMHAANDASARTARRRELREAVNEWSSAHDALRHGSDRLNVARIHSPEIDAVWRTLQPHFEAMRQAGLQLSLDEPPLNEPVVPSRGFTPELMVLVQHEAHFLAAMERIVQLMEWEAAAELRRLRIVSLTIAVAIFGLLLGLGRFVVRPATVVIRNHVEQLEVRVEQRTRELNATLASLRHEIHEREVTESQNRALASRLAHADRVESLGRLAAGLAHELNQPLGAIANYAEACDATLAAPWNDEVPARLQRYLRELKQASLRAGAIIRRVRNFIRPSVGNTAAVNLNAIVAEVVDLCRAEAAHREVEVALDLPALELTVTGDSVQIQQVLVNLVQNALQAMADVPSHRRRLAIRVTPADQAVQIDVIDSGPGLMDTDPETLFAPFHTTKAHGLGIGLSICRSIVEQHQGTIWAKSAPSGGAQFSFVLPLTPEHVAEPVH
ncbi:MAG: type IV pili methyl-accepting chemotaxis transducer N-terminal domain-containing protein [Planctomycetes bacterium]|nr:type IV pili methyl-accepting chemotaxis transducer N-terminal domain-containing protein [Planctomycetota bacterium]